MSSPSCRPGGGKSLCFQLPALLRDGLTIVVSPLISLMKDQVDALQASGVAATFLNSALDGTQARSRLRGLYNGEFRLLYVAPERLMLESFIEKVKEWNVAQIAIDEAHCISEWGHDFRPEYRELARLRETLPDVPIMALTATATERVRGDILQQLKLRDPRCYVASFDRPNLTYRVVPKSAPYDQLLEFLQSRPNDSGIVYCASRKTADSVAAKLNADGIPAKPYHAGLEAKERAQTSGDVPARRRPRGERDDRLRDGDQQAERPLRRALRSAEEHRELLPGNRAGRTRRPAERMRAPLQRERCGQADAFHRGKKRERSADRARTTAPDGALRRDARMPPHHAPALFRGGTA